MTPIKALRNTKLRVLSLGRHLICGGPQAQPTNAIYPFISCAADKQGAR
jgi:hypothetical protein